MKLNVLRLQLRGLRPLPRSSKEHRSNAALAPRAIMTGYQYQLKAEKLRSRGLDVKEFGGRVLREGCFGEDVLALQSWLSDESYYNPLDGGMTGYFGSVTKEALMNWQRDNHLESNGVFDEASKWQYLSACEAHLAARAVSLHSAAPPAVPSGTTSAVTTAITAVVPYAVITVLAFAATIATKRFIAPVFLSFFTRTTKTTASHHLDTNKPSRRRQQQQQGHLASAAEKATNAQHTTTNKKQQQEQGRLRRLSDEELQRYIAPMKGSSPSRSPIQRPAPRPYLSTDSNQGIKSSKYGNYYGGKEVLERVKEYLRDESGYQAPVGATAQRMQAIGYDTLRNKNKGLREKVVDGQQQGFAEKKTAAVLTSPLQRAQSPLKSFQDVVVDDAEKVVNIVAGVPTSALLNGTDLEAAPVERVPARPVAVVKPSVNAQADAAKKVERVEMDPLATVVLAHKPIKVHKPARLVATTRDDEDKL